MKYNLHPFCRYVKYSFSAALLAVFILPTSVVAQDEEDDDDMFLEEVIVTGSRLQRSDYNSMSPISVFSDVDILESAVTTLERFVQSIPSVNGGYYSSAVNNGTAGYATVSLRGLGSNRTLIVCSFPVSRIVAEFHVSRIVGKFREETFQQLCFGFSRVILQRLCRFDTRGVSIRRDLNRPTVVFALLSEFRVSCLCGAPH